MTEHGEPSMKLSSPRLNSEFQRLPKLLGQHDLFRLSQAVRTTPDYSRAELELLLRDEHEPEQMRFAAMYCLLVRARHLRNFDEFRTLAYAHATAFAEQPAMLAMMAEADSFFAFTGHELRAVLDKCRTALERFDGVGVKLLAAETLLEVAQVESEQRQPQLLAEAQSYVDDALARYPRMPRYLAVKAQVLGRRGDFSGARACITEAISLEDSTNENYYIRLARYEAVRSEIGLLEASKQLATKLADAVTDFDQTRGSLIEIVGLLAAVLALVITGTQVATQMRGQSAAGLLMVVGGVVLFSFTGFSVLLGRAIRVGRIVAVALLAMTLIATGTLLVVGVSAVQTSPPRTSSGPAPTASAADH